MSYVLRDRDGHFLQARVLQGQRLVTTPDAEQALVLSEFLACRLVERPDLERLGFRAVPYETAIGIVTNHTAKP